MRKKLFQVFLIVAVISSLAVPVILPLLPEASGEVEAVESGYWTVVWPLITIAGGPTEEAAFLASAQWYLQQGKVAFSCFCCGAAAGAITDLTVASIFVLACRLLIRRLAVPPIIPEEQR